MELLKKGGIDDVVVCAGHLGDLIEQHFGDGRRFAVTIRYAYEDPERLLGTAGALKNAEALLGDRFFVVYGDSYPILDYRLVADYFSAYDRLGLMVVVRNEDRWDRSNAVVEGAYVRAYGKRERLPGMVYCDFGVSMFRREALSGVASDTSADLGDVHQDLIRRGELLAYETPDRVYEVGSARGLHEFTTLVSSGAIDAAVTARLGS